MKMNPYSLVFGKEPAQLISRTVQVSHVIDSFKNPDNPQQVFIITGVRGTGKTVLMTKISKKLKNEQDWIVVGLNPEKDLLQMLGASLSAETQWARLFQPSDAVNAVLSNFIIFGLCDNYMGIFRYIDDLA